MKEKQQFGSIKLLLAKGIADKIVGAQLRTAEVLSRWERKCSIIQKKVAFAIFLASGITFCTSIMLDAWLPEDSADSAIIDIGKPHQGHPLPFAGLVDSTHVE